MRHFFHSITALTLCFTVNTAVMAQSDDDVEVTDSTSTEWGGGTGGLLNTIIIMGDVNNDGQVGIADIVAITNVMAEITSDADTRKRADVNADEQVGIADIVAVTNIMAGK